MLNYSSFFPMSFSMLVRSSFLILILILIFILLIYLIFLIIKSILFWRMAPFSLLIMVGKGVFMFRFFMLSLISFFNLSLSVRIMFVSFLIINLIIDLDLRGCFDFFWDGNIFIFALNLILSRRYLFYGNIRHVHLVL